VDTQLPIWLRGAYWAVLVLVALVGGDEEARIRWWHRALFVVVVGSSVVLVFTMIWVTFTPVGSRSVPGIQGRYLIPAAPLLILALYRSGPRVWGLTPHLAWTAPAFCALALSTSVYRLVDRYYVPLTQPEVAAASVGAAAPGPTVKASPAEVRPAAPELLVVGYDLPSRWYQPGEVIPLKVRLKVVRQPTIDYLVAAHLDDAAGQTRSQADRKVQVASDGTLPEPGRVAEQALPLTVGVDVPSGLYRLEVFVIALSTYERVSAPEPSASGEGRLPPLRVAVLPEGEVLRAGQVWPSHRLDVAFGGQVALLGYDLPSNHARAGRNVQANLYLEAIAVPREDYTVFLHVLDSEGKLVAQADSWPLRGQYPTSLWQQGDVVRDTIVVSLPSNMAPGDYRLLAGVYLLETMERLPARDAAGRSLGDATPLAILTVDPDQ
jgi:hypothetical protein